MWKTGIIWRNSIFTITFSYFIFYTCIYTFIPARIPINHRIIPTVSIQIQPVSLIDVLLQEPAQYRVIVPCTQIILFRYSVILLAGIADAVGKFFRDLQSGSERIIEVLIFYRSRLIRDQRRAELFVRMIVIRSLTSSNCLDPCSQVAAGCFLIPSFFIQKFSVLIHEPEQLPVFSHLMAQAFHIVTVFLYLTVCALHPDLLVFTVVKIPADPGFGFLPQYTSLFTVGKEISSSAPVWQEFFRMDELVFSL